MHTNTAFVARIIKRTPNRTITQASQEAEFLSGVTPHTGDQNNDTAPSTPRSKSNFVEMWATLRWSKCHPEDRGLLMLERDCHQHLARYKLYPKHYLFSNWERHPKTFQERRMAEANNLEELAPHIRGRRKVPSLFKCWDGQHAHRERSWKVKKVKRQWMLSL
jgi:hypothetical protein